MTGFLLIFLVTCLSFWLQFGTSNGRTMFAPINAIGLVGNITFIQESNLTETTVAIYLNPVIETTASIDYTWKIMSFPHFLDNPCSEASLGKVTKDMSVAHGPIQVPNPNIAMVSYTDPDLSLFDKKTIWLSSVIIQKTDGTAGCSNILEEGEITTARAKFVGPSFAGSILLRQNKNEETILFSQLAYIEEEFRTTSKHDWKILISDILDMNPDTHDKCNYLTNLLDPDNQPDDECSTSNHNSCKIGDLTKKHGQLTIYNDNGYEGKQKFIDTNLPLTFFDSLRSSYIVLYEKNDPNRVLACAIISLVKPKEVKANIDMDGVKGYIGFSQAFNFDPTIVTINLNHLNGRGDPFKIHKFPVDPKQAIGENVCSENVLGPVFNPHHHAGNTMVAQGSTDQYPIGDLSGKYGMLTNLDNEIFDVFSIHVDLNLPLFGHKSIIGRSLSIHKTDGTSWICANIGYPGETTTAISTFYYPIFGKIIFRQEAHAPFTETTVYVDLAYSDGTANNTGDHSWHVHVDPPGADWYNWSGRCLSVGGHYNPGLVGYKKYANCKPSNQHRCEVGDLTGKSAEKISIAAYKGAKLVKLFYTDTNLALSGTYSIIDRSVVVHDKNGPAQRGNRLACAAIKKLHSLQVAARTWRTSASKSYVYGSLTFSQDSAYDGTNVEIDLYGLDKNTGLHVHKTAVPIDREFPCSADSVQLHYDPFEVGNNLSFYPGVGSSDQYEVGDISGKTVSIAELETHKLSYIDNNLPLFGIHSIIGRSIVLHSTNPARMACASILPEVENSAAKEIIALASFDDPRHKISGYIRFRQFEYNDGSVSETWMDVDLKHAGLNNRNVTNDHKWEVFVNQVGADAYQPTESVRCLGGGYVWNPLQTVRNEPIYRQQCSKFNPLRCQLGDLTGRHGPLEIGGKRKIFTDVNLPLVGPNSVVGRSLVIYHQGENNENKIACTNIKLDIHQQLTVSIRNTPTFTVAKFMDHMRKELRTTEWLVIPDTQSYAVVLNDECVTLTVNFYGQKAEMLHKAFQNLVRFGTTQYSDELGTYKLTTPYAACNPFSESVSGSNNVFLSSMAVMTATVGLLVRALISRSTQL